MELFTTRQNYSRAEQISDRVVHVAGLVIVAIAVPVLLWLAFHRRAGTEVLTALSVYGASLIAMILFSALYNTLGQRRWTGVLRRLDHSAIYAKIAGTYTAFLVLPGLSMGHWLVVIWTTAAAGIGLKLISPSRLRWLALALYLGLGWIGVLSGGAFFAHLSTPVIGLIIAGGALYTAGVVFYLCEGLPFHYTIWHLFVLTASLVFYGAVTLHMVATTAA
ncbi:Hly-III family protein [Thioclava sp. BHET1]|nr:Hly-III family protein [Thioclava sp. BHET1]